MNEKERIIHFSFILTEWAPTKFRRVCVCVCVCVCFFLFAFRIRIEFYKWIYVCVHGRSPCHFLVAVDVVIILVIIVVVVLWFHYSHCKKRIVFVDNSKVNLQIYVKVLRSIWTDNNVSTVSEFPFVVLLSIQPKQCNIVFVWEANGAGVSRESVLFKRIQKHEYDSVHWWNFPLYFMFFPAYDINNNQIPS